MLKLSRKPLNEWNEDELLNELQRVSLKIGKSPTQAEFDANSHLCKAQVLKKVFKTWNIALENAELQVTRTQKTVNENDIFYNIDLYLSKNSQPLEKITRDDFITYTKNHCPISIGRGVIEGLFGSWKGCINQYNFNRENPISTDKREELTKYNSTNIKNISINHNNSTLPPSFKTGNPTGSKIFIYEPMNEQGVVCLFGILAEKLGFIIQGVQTGYPDCYAKKRRTINKIDFYEDCYIEFEYKSSNYKKHKHELRNGYYIVCWEHDWKDVPDTMHVICLKDELKKLKI